MSKLDDDRLINEQESFSIVTFENYREFFTAEDISDEDLNAMIHSLESVANKDYHSISMLCRHYAAEAIKCFREYNLDTRFLTWSVSVFQADQDGNKVVSDLSHSVVVLERKDGVDGPKYLLLEPQDRKGLAYIANTYEDFYKSLKSHLHRNFRRPENEDYYTLWADLVESIAI